MYCANCAKINSADSRSFGLSDVTHWNINGKSSGQPPSGKIEEARNALATPLTSHMATPSSYPHLPAAMNCRELAEKKGREGLQPNQQFSSTLQSSSAVEKKLEHLPAMGAGVWIEVSQGIDGLVDMKPIYGTTVVRKLEDAGKWRYVYKIPAGSEGKVAGRLPAGDSYLVAGTDGVGTKLKLAFETGIHESIGIDLVAMSVNDIVTSGAKPLFFLDYFATSHLDVDLAEKVIKGIVDGCQQSDCALLGGETAEMPDFYADGEYDLSGFAVGIVKKDSVIDGKNITVGDVLVGLPSSGVHSNGFSLVRRFAFALVIEWVLAQSGLSLNNQLPGEIVTLGEALMAPTVIYVKQVLDIISKGGVKGIAHVTGGGFTDNIPRVFPKGLGALIYKDSWVIPSVFKWIQQAGRIEDSEMRRTFNMGIGMVLVVSQEAAHRILGDAKGAYTAYRIGELTLEMGTEEIPPFASTPLTEKMKDKGLVLLRVLEE
ncbi:hypothetical protein TEA_010382 [Camellia sinensis var. sinensis]|uniref:phosphoribosylformylglycinamidine cyclo-ligase n=1 Tax=Camellia sinensis var. sinensis TaxID=542762 RepID=A0A4S4E5S3_CAMSN|nr:hypothetical protein TEA_010382 [Camellia sinensis var. sinensis]